ncbi:MAG TPA: M14 family metallopeptidase [Gaiellaceae bacterium]|nr:M14 family metallopeptidase [Gaiellaceae bacterium]
MRLRGARTALLVVALVALAIAGSATAQESERGIDPNQGRSLVEINLPDKAAAIELQLEADDYGIDFNDHYLRKNADGSVTVTVFGNADELAALEAAGYALGTTIEGPATWRERAKDWQADVQAEETAEAAALAVASAEVAPSGDIIVLRVDYFENYAGRFLSVEAKDGTRGSSTTGESLVVAWNTGAGSAIDQGPRTMNVNIDPDTTPDTYIEHRILVKVGDVNTSSPAAPTRIRIGSSNGTFVEADVNTWLGGGLPPMSSNFLSNFTTRYMDPTEVYGRFRELADEFPDLTTIIPLPNKTNGYQRRAQALMAGLTNPALTGNLSGTVGTQAVILTSRAWGHEGGNELTAEFVNPLVANSPLSVSFVGNDLVVTLATGATGALTSTATQVAAAINAHPGAAAKLVAQTYRGNAGAGIVQARPKGNLSDFLTAVTNGVVTNAHVPRGPFEYFVMRIGKNRPGNSADQGIHGRRVGVFLYCQQHAREWATPLTCLETAEQLLRNYGIDKTTRKLVDELDIFILPSSNPDGSHYSMHNFNSQRRTMTNWCMHGSLETDDPNAANFWTPRPRLGGGTPEPFNDSAARNAWGTDMNRNNTFGTLLDGYIGASTSCVSDVFAGPSEASEPEIQNELWIADTFKNIKFSNNIHSFGGYFMWAPGTYLPDRGEGAAVHANIGVEKYFFQAGDRILNRIKEVRNTAILPERTGPIADVLYSAAGNSADEHWYNRGVIAYSFETGADRFGALEQTTVSVASAAGATGVRSNNRNLFTPLEKVTFDPGLPTEETRTVLSVSAQNPSSPNPNIFFTEQLQFAHASGAIMRGQDLTQQGVGFQPPYDTEGKFEALEFAAGNYGLLESAYDYSNDNKGPEVIMTGVRSSSTPITTTFQYVSEPAVIRYTTDGSKPSNTSTLWDSTGPREPGQSFVVTTTTEFRWLATDMAGNQTTGRATFQIK